MEPARRCKRPSRPRRQLKSIIRSHCVDNGFFFMPMTMLMALHVDNLHHLPVDKSQITRKFICQALFLPKMPVDNVDNYVYKCKIHILCVENLVEGEVLNFLHNSKQSIDNIYDAHKTIAIRASQNIPSTKSVRTPTTHKTHSDQKL